MRVDALRDLLDTMPGDLLVLVNGVHVEYVVREHPRTRQAITSVSHECECGDRHTHYVNAGIADVPGAISLHHRNTYGKGKGAGDPEPPPTFHGFRTKASKAAIDKHSEDPDA